MLHSERFMRITEDSGGVFTYFIRTESKHPKVLMHKNEKLRRIDVGKEKESASNKPEAFSFWLHKYFDRPSKTKSNIVIAKSEHIASPPPNETIPEDLPHSNHVELSMNQFPIDTDMKGYDCMHLIKMSSTKEKCTEYTDAIYAQTIDADNPACHNL